MSEYVRAYEGNEPFVFVSYAHRNSDKVIPVISKLYEKKYRVWYDEGIFPGSEWPHNIESHLKKAEVVIVFVSEDSLSSPNCENEVRVALGKRIKQADENKEMAAAVRIRKKVGKNEKPSAKKKEIIQISLDAKTHPELAHVKTLNYDDELIDALTRDDYLGDKFIGDGITGYQYAIDKKTSFNTWNLMLALAVVLAVVLGTALYGLYNGWFDALLPAKQPVVEAAAPTIQPQEVISIDDNIIGSILPIEFSSEEEKNAVYEKLGWTQPSEMTYKDLVGMDGLTHLEISDEPIYDISFAAYLPDLEVITLYNAQITDLSPLIECPKLEAVQVTADMLPMTLPTPRRFEVEVM